MKRCRDRLPPRGPPGAIGENLATAGLLERVSDVSIADVMRATQVERQEADAVRRVLEVPELAREWRSALEMLRA